MVIPGKKTKTAALPLTGIPCALTPYMRNTAKKILIVDENHTCRESLGVSIKSLGYEVFEAATGQEAIDKGFQHTSRSDHDGSTSTRNE
jgi:hypothetical protein